MLSGVLNRGRAIHVDIAIMRVFVKIREMISTHKELAKKLERVEQKIEKHDIKIESTFDAIRQLMTPPSKSDKQIGFYAE